MILSFFLIFLVKSSGKSYKKTGLSVAPFIVHPRPLNKKPLSTQLAEDKVISPKVLDLFQHMRLSPLFPQTIESEHSIFFILQISICLICSKNLFRLFFCLS